MTAAKGSTLRTTLDFLAQEHGEATATRVLGRLPGEQRRHVENAAPTAEVPLELLLALWGAAEAELGATHPKWIERSGAFSIESGGMQMYAGILKKASPLEFLTQRVSLFRLYYQPGNMEVVQHGSGHAVLRLVGFAHGSPLFCRRQTGGLQRALELAGGDVPQVRHVRCALEDDAFCEWELRWR